MPKSALEMKFDFNTINHLGLKMYSTIPKALAEIIANSYDADAENVIVKFIEKNGLPEKIEVIDDGMGLSFEEINKKFLVIGRDRRQEEGDIPSPRFGRLPIGKKGLGKLALFGMARTITISTVKNGKKSEFTMRLDDLMNSQGNYKPQVVCADDSTDKENGTTIILEDLKRKSSFDVDRYMG